MFKSLKGMPDILPDQIRPWQIMEWKLFRLCHAFGYKEIRTPHLEPTSLFARSIGGDTDVVEKEMFAFTDKGGDQIALRPEGTASVVRAYLEHNLAHGSSLRRLFYMGPMFRHERPQKGRFRQFYQAGAEAIGSDDPAVDSEIISLLWEVGRMFHLKERRMEINSVGDGACRPVYRERLQTYLRARSNQLCETCQRRTETNPMRVFDCKSEVCQELLREAPLILEHLCPPCRDHFDKVQEHLSACGVSFVVNSRIVRGLDYYTRTAFEFSASGLGSQNVVGAGGRYDGLAQELGGPSTPAIGFALGLERLLMASDLADRSIPNPRKVCFLPLGEQAQKKALELASHFRRAHLRKGGLVITTVVLGKPSLKSAMRQANREGADSVFILGDDELAQEVVVEKNLKTNLQEPVSWTKLLQEPK